MQTGDAPEPSLSHGEKEEAEKQRINESKGAKPKVRNPREAKRRRFVMKQAKNIAKPQHLESVSEKEESQTLLPPAAEGTSPWKGSEFFGVRSYVHTFYEAMAMDNLHGYEDTRFGYRAPIRKRRKQVICWRMTLASGIIILVMGAISISIGFFVPKKKEMVDSQEDLEIIDRAQQAFNKDLDICKVVGLILFCVGGAQLAIVFFALTYIWKSRKEDPLSSEDLPMVDVPEDGEDFGPPIDVKVPLTEGLEAVQPKRVDPEEVVMTNAGLCKVP